jgi:hypothetical protein
MTNSLLAHTKSEVEVTPNLELLATFGMSLVGALLIISPQAHT